MYGYQADAQVFAQIWFRNPADLSKIVTVLEVSKVFSPEVTQRTIYIREYFIFFNVLFIHDLLFLSMGNRKEKFLSRRCSLTKATYHTFFNFSWIMRFTVWGGCIFQRIAYW
jgi:hypothetical protein